MFYTLLKFLGWGLLLAFVGGCIGWALRALKCRGEIAAARASTVDGDEVERMRHRLANLEQVVAERDRLRMQIADMRHADSPGVVGIAASEPEPEPEPVVDDGPDAIDADTDGATTASGFAGLAAVDTDDSAAPDPGTDEPETDEPETDEPETDDGDEPDSAIDLDAAAAVLGKKVVLDDLTTVEGIGPKISELCSSIGVTTWRQLAATDVAELQSMLDAAGSRYQMHDPGSWPRQAGLLAAGSWDEFQELTDQLRGGR